MEHLFIEQSTKTQKEMHGVAPSGCWSWSSKPAVGSFLLKVLVVVFETK